MTKDAALGEWANITAIACDVPDCGNVIRVSPASQPKYWGRLTVVLRSGREMVERDMCPQCSLAICELLNTYRRPKAKAWPTDNWPKPKDKW